MEKIKQIFHKCREVILYLVFGVLTTVVSFATAAIAKWVLEQVGADSGMVSTVSTAFSWICAVTFAYITNRLWVFESKANGKWKIFVEAASFYGGRVTTLLFEMAVMWVGFSWLQFNYWAVKIVANVGILILNYVISKVFVFRDTKEKE